MRVKLAIAKALQFWALCYAFNTVFIVLGKQHTWYASLIELVFLVILGWRYAAKLGADITTEAFAYGIWWVLTFAALDYFAVRPFESTLYDQFPYFVGLMLVLFLPLIWFRRHHAPVVPNDHELNKETKSEPTA